MDIIAISYKNIWPFENKEFSIFFPKWKYLVNAPIGYWKSFLFFDSPIYGLYKYQTRKLLNSNASEWFIKLIFKSFDNYYLIIRNLKPWKKEDKCISDFFELPNFNPENFQKEFPESTIKHNFDIQDFFKNESIKKQEFKNESDLWQYLSHILPVKEVFLSTTFLMQDSENIFQLSSWKRIEILKNMFWLTFLDEAKKIIADKKRNITSEIKVLSNTENFDKKLQSNISIILENINILSQSQQIQQIINSQKEIFSEFEFMKDKISINNFQIPDNLINLTSKISDHITNQNKNFLKFQTKLDTLKQEKDKTLQEIQNKENQIQIKNTKIDEIKKIISKIDEQELLSLKKIKADAYSQIQNLNNSVSNLNHDLLDSAQTLEQFNETIYTLINNGKSKKAELEKTQAEFELEKNKISNIEKELSNFDFQKEGTNSNQLYKQEINSKKQLFLSEIQNQKSQLENLKEKESQHKINIHKIEEKIQKFNWFLAEQSYFNCSKIQWNCPFVKEIKKDSFQKFESELSQLKQEQDLIKQEFVQKDIPSKIKNLQTQISNTEKNLDQLEQNPSEFIKEFFQKLESQKETLQIELKKRQTDLKDKKFESTIQEIQKELSKISDFFNKIPRKQIQSDYQKSKELQNQISQIDSEISKIEQEFAKLEEYKSQLQTAQIQIEEIKLQIESLHKENEKILLQLEQTKKEVDNPELQNLRLLESAKNSLSKTISIIQSQIEDFQIQQNKLNQIIEEEKIVWNLYKIFSKEILLYVLEENLPILNEVINNYLSQIVDFQIDMKLENISDKLELEITIFKWNQQIDVKSLSGWQKVVLKLVWMLAICVYNKSSMLFLDETINNLDEHTVAKVSSVIENFIKQQDIKMYVVTHSKQIQQMNIRDWEISEI